MLNLIFPRFYGFLYSMLLFVLIFPTSYAQKFEFALIGDMPYEDADVRKFKNLVREINGQRKIKWVMHTGDVKTGGTPCTDEYIKGRFNLYQTFTKPFIITPGDNEWTDCHREGAGNFDPLERLTALRKLFYANPHKSLGQQLMPLETQQDNPNFRNFPENQRWEKNGVWFATCHIVGSQNGMAPFANRRITHTDEVRERTTACIAWLKETFEKAKNDKGVFIMMHANPGFEMAADSSANPGFYTFLKALEEAIIAFNKPVLLAHGDSHYFRYDKPLLNRNNGRRIEHFTRIEAFGARDIHWTRILVNGKDPNLFQIKQELVISNFENHAKP